MKKLKVLLLSALLFTPVFAMAQVNNSGIVRLIGQLEGIVTKLVPFVIGIALLVFLWGVLGYLTKKDSAGKEESRNFMVWGLIALFVMVSVWGIVGLLVDTIFPGSENINTVPVVPSIPSAVQR